MSLFDIGYKPMTSYGSIPCSTVLFTWKTKLFL